MKKFIFFLNLWFSSNVIALKIYRSNSISQDEKVFSGLFYKRKPEEKFTSSNNFTVCIRFTLKRLSVDESAKLIVIENTKYEKFFNLYAQYPATWFHFGNLAKHGRGLKASWILYDHTMKSYLVWSMHKWHHTCFSFSKSNSYISFVKVRSKDRFH